jgi:hypothetical protein
VGTGTGSQGRYPRAPWVYDYGPSTAKQQRVIAQGDSSLRL